MTNFEYWKNRILEITKTGGVSVEQGIPVESKCKEEYCDRCDFFDGKGVASCNRALIKWLYSEHEKKPELTRQERKLCEALGTGWIAADEDGTVYWYESLPMKGEHSYRNRGNVMCVSNAGFHFAFMDFEGEEPWMVENLLLLEVEE